MNAADALNELARSYGIAADFHDLSGAKCHTSPETVKALLRANGLQLDNDAMILEACAERRACEAARKYPRELVVTRGEPLVLKVPNATEWHLTLDGHDGIALEGGRADVLELPPLASGIHTLTILSGQKREKITLIATPKAAPSIDEMTGRSKLWGINTALYGLRSARNSGLGDYEDLANLAEIAADRGAGFIGINPVHCFGWSDTETTSPYSPSHRGFLNTAHIAADQIAGLDHSTAARNLLQDNEFAFAAIKASDTVNYAQHTPLHRKLLRSLFRIFAAEASSKSLSDFLQFCENGGEALAKFTQFEALSEDHGPDWRRWPDDLKCSNSSGIAAACEQLSERVRFHSWLQWIASTQISDAQTRALHAGMSLGLYLDLAVGPRRGAAETWCDQETVANGVSLGAPPDQLSPAGQNWDLAANAPEKLMQGQYQALRRILSETMQHAGVLRIDHVLGMNRSYWVPDDGSPGGYIRQPFKSLLAVVAIEAERAGTVVVGEDLGLVPDGFRDTINERGLYSYSVLQYEKDGKGQFHKPQDLRPQSLACFGTHDTPTLKGFLTGRDIDWWEKLGWIDGREEQTARIRREAEIRDLLALNDETPNLDPTPPRVDPLTNLHEALAISPVAMVSVQLDDLLGEIEAQNLPGTIDEHPNWSRRCKLPVERIGSLPGLVQVSRIMAEHGRSKRVMEPRKDTG